MKYSDVTGPRAFSLTADLMDAVKPLEDDPEVAALFAQERRAGESSEEYGAKLFRESSTLLMDKHRDDLVNIFSIIRGITPNEYRESMTVDMLLEDVAGLFSDGDFKYIFFPSPIRKEKKGSGSTSESTGARQL